MIKNKYVSMFVLILAVLILLSSPVRAAEIGGACGSNLTWSFDAGTGTLTIAGQGAMDTGGNAPWSDYAQAITNVVIGSGVTSVDHFAFSGCKNLQSVSLPSTVTAIGQNAFSNCSGLSSISLDHITSMASYAFSDCSSLTSVTIPSGLSTISYGAFDGCNRLQSIQFHGSVTEIGSYAFSGCSSLTSVTIPDSVTAIGDSAFSGCYSLSSVTLSSRLTALGGNAFSSCPNLASIRIPDGVAELGPYTFSSCSALQEVYLGAGVSYIDSTAFDSCTSLRSFNVSGGNASFSADSGVLYNGSKTTLLLMPKGFNGSYTVLSGTVTIGEYACYEVPGLTGITLPNSVTSIEKYAFCGASGLSRIQLSNSLQTIGTYALARTGISEVLIPASVSSIKVMAFSGCYQLSKITFVGEAPSIGDMAFANVTAIVYYPGDLSSWSWSSGTIDHYGGTLDWISTSCDEHKPVTDPGTAPTCTASGLTEGSHCGNCMAVLREQESIPATGHRYNDCIAVDADTHKGTCTVCGYDDISSHNWDDGTIIEHPSCIALGKQRYTCADCGYEITEELPTTSHSYDHDCDNTCNVCGDERTTSHSYSDTYQADRENHWYRCQVCGEETDAEPHTPGDAATEEAPQICTVCDYVLVPTLSHIHEFADTWSWDDSKHWHDCDTCPEYGDEDTHAFINACDPDCDVCGFTRQTSHAFATKWKMDSTTHWKQCVVCGFQDHVTDHTPGPDPTETSAQTCTVCGYELAPVLSTEPPAETTVPPVQDEPAPEAGYPWWILILILTATAIGTFLFLNRKKK